jgi:L-aspartate oxidase
MSDFPGRTGLSVRDSECLVVGSGIAGLTAALTLAPQPVAVLTKARDGGSTAWARGGIAAAVGPDDSAALHAADTLAVGGGLNDPAAVEILADEGAARIADLVALGMRFDGDGGRPSLGREAGHGRRRILHAEGDATGAAVLATLLRAAETAPSVTLEEGALAWDLVVAAGRVRGLIAFHAGEGWVFHRSDRVILATGGIGRAWRHTTNPAEATGDGLAMAARAGAALADLEFVQFHPTALAVGEEADGALPLLTEALRGDGALLVDTAGRRFMAEEHPDAELAPRDVVARAVWRRAAAGGAFLDLRPVAELERRFPSAAAACRRAGLDPLAAPVPVTAAAHYHMGGIATDALGRTSLPGLWACGEAACTGVHGANRLASNSLLEGLVFGRRAALDALGHAAGGAPLPAPKWVAAPSLPGDAVAKGIDRVRDAMADRVAVARDGAGLASAAAELSALEGTLAAWAPQPGQPFRLPTTEIAALGRLRNLAAVGRLVARAALARRESRGAHWRSDCPEAAPAAAPDAAARPAMRPRPEPASAGLAATGR